MVIFLFIFIPMIRLLIIFISVFLLIMNILVYNRSWDARGTTISLFATRSNRSWLSCITFNSRCSGCAFSSCFTDRSSASWNSWFSRHTTRSHWAHRTDNRFSWGAGFSFASWDSGLSWFSWAWDWDFNVEDFFLA